MSIKKLLSSFIIALFFLAACSQTGGQGPGMSQGGRPDKSQDALLNQLKRDVLPKFRQMEFKGENVNMQYSLFAPVKMEIGKKYPLILFMADASTAGKDVLEPLSQGYGALIWATNEAQEKNPCFVLVPQFSKVAVNDAYEHSPEVEAVLELLKAVEDQNAIDPSRLYVTGQSMGGMIGMYLNIKHPGIFAASLYVDCHWDQSGFDKLVEQPFIFVSAGSKGPSWTCSQAIQEACRKMGVSYTWAEWNARLPLTEQDDLSKTMLDKGQPVNLISFESGTVLPADGKGSEHMYAFDHAYQLSPVRDWLFLHSLKKPAFKK